MKKLFLIIICSLFIFGCSKKNTLYDEPTIFVGTNDQIIKANTGSFCDQKHCVDKTIPIEMNYNETLNINQNEEIKINDLEYPMTKVTIYNCDTKEELNITNSIVVDNQNKSLLIRDYTGTFIVVITTNYQNAPIDYSFKLKINSKKEESEMKLNLKVGNVNLSATLASNSSVDALVEQLRKNDITLTLNDYGNMEKVGDLPFNLPRNDEPISTDYGDIILYLGKTFSIYYDKNNYSLTRLGKIDNISQAELKRILKDENIKVTLSLKNN